MKNSHLTCFRGSAISSCCGDNMDFYNNIKELLIDNELTKRVKDYSKNKSDLTTYYDVGGLIKKAGKKYGEAIVKNYSEQLTKEVGKGYTVSALKRMRQFYMVIQKGATLSHLLSYSHYVELVVLDDINAINYYINAVISNKLTVRNLRKRIKNKEYERLDEDTRNKIVSNDDLELVDIVKNPILIRNTIGVDNISEKMLQRLVLENLNEFLDELGDGYSYVKNEYKIKIGDSYNYIDLLLFNYIYNAFVVVELKVTELKKEHIGQTLVYMNYIDEHVKSINQNKTIGIIIVKVDNKFVMHYYKEGRMISREYELI